MKKLLEYNYYLFAEKFVAIEKEKVIFFVTIIQYLFVVNSAFLVMILLFESMKKFSLPLLIFCVIFFFILKFHNRKKYKSKYDEFKTSWNNEDETQKKNYKSIIWGLVIWTFILMIINSNLIKPV